MSVENIMTAKVVSIEPGCPLVEVVKKLYAYGVSCVLVCEDELPVGIISERDIIGYALNLATGKAEPRETATDLMTSPLTTVRSDAPVDDAVAIVTEHRIRHLPVVDADGKLVGLLTQSNLLHALSD
ncbi:MAG: CBS domain-containing protein [Deltaproteobacteria bacterium]|nr:CBS domain-containing protein [Deltaproteobacteria bacterium]